MSANTVRENAGRAGLGEVLRHQLAATQTTGRAWYPIFNACYIEKIKAMWSTAGAAGTLAIYVHKARASGATLTSGQLLGSFDLTATADIELTLDLSAISTKYRRLEDGDWIAMEMTAAPTNMQGGVVSVHLSALPDA